MIKFIGRQELLNGKWVRLFNLHLPSGQVPTFCVGAHECLKTRMKEIQKRFGPKEIA